MRILVAGDTHHSRDWCATLSKLARRHHCTYVLQLGDFGYWPRWANKRGKRTGESFLDDVNRHAEQNGVEWVFIDGNHDDLETLRNHSRDPDGFVTIRQHVRYAPRGQRWEWDDVRFGALGGAFTIDAIVDGRQQYTAGVDWFPEIEQVTDVDVEALRFGELDVLVCHDVPDGVPLQGWRISFEKELLANQTRVALRRAVEQTTPALLLHGHWHVRHSTELEWIDPQATESSDNLVWEHTDIEGLAADVQGDHRAWAVLDLDSLDLLDLKDGSQRS